MQLFVGLGNPGSSYVGNRHNIGFMVVEAIAKRHNLGPWRRRFQGVTAEGPLGTERVLLLLPGTYMNESGRAVADAAHFYKLGVEQIVVFHDEIDLAPAKVRVKTGGGVAGHNGLRSISAHVGNDYRRVRIGVGHPGVKERVHGHVLSDFAKSERDWVDALCAIVADNAELLAKGQDASFQNKVHLAMQAKGFGEAPEAPVRGT
ncbi:MAG: aminoacyl-tRNA hydrolase [Xanthobacteraceae bacterium]